MTNTGCTRPSTIHNFRDGVCTGCGYNQNAAFERMLNLEDAVRLGLAAQAGTMAGKPDFAKAQTAAGVETAKTELFSMVSSLTETEARAFGRYRENAR